MAGDPQQTARLRALHDDCVWRVNEAVAEGREDLIRMLSEEYLEQAVRILAADLPATGPRCGREGCGVCGAARPAPQHRRRWSGR
jgi:hypothetical protein